MGAVVKLVAAKPRKGHARPVLTQYHSRRGPVRNARSCTARAAIVNATRHLLEGDYAEAYVYDERRRLVASLVPMPTGISVTLHRRRGL